MSECSEKSCERGSCEETSKKCCACGTACGGDPAACAMAIWRGSFFQAMKELQVETLKPKLQKIMGAKMDKAADAAVESMMGMWQSMLTKAKSQQDFQERLCALWSEGK